ncbi:MAG: hypothetical protein K2Y05_10540, partial [Hyphomicrobiaceae bacterium]|nr:hypothetical protein [Hyphomicrobiaceae bacterium]
MMRRFAQSALWQGFTLLTIVVALVALAPSLHAIEVEYSSGPVRREILAIYDSRTEKKPAETRIHQFVEMPLNWLGLTVVYADVNGPLPTDLGRYRGIVSWFIEPLATADTYLAWIDDATARGTRLAVFANLAPGHSKPKAVEFQRVHRRIGLEVTDDYITVTHKTKISVYDQAMVGFERPIDKVLPDFQVMSQADSRITVHLAARTAGYPSSAEQVLVSTGPGGGYVSDNYTITFEPVTDRVQWTINPFEFLKRSFGLEQMPIPDITTLSGRRVYFSHIDGDGWNNVSTVDGYRQAGTLSSDVIKREAIEPFPDLPVTVGVIAGDVHPDYGGLPAGREIARKIFALPNVEVGSHTFTHPFDWSFFQNYDRAKEAQRIETVAEPSTPWSHRAQRFVYSLAGVAGPKPAQSRYTAGSGDAPRTYMQRPFELEHEVAGALSFSESLAPPGKKAKLYQWSGNCLPFEGAIAAVRATGARNMNGGDTRFDSGFPSVFYVPPISKPVGRERQIYAANSNENTYTNDWTGPFYGFALLADTIRNTETPRRLKPFNVYYHMYSGEKESALNALLQNLRLARSLSLTPISASRYAAMADDFFAVKIEQIGPRSWRVGERGEVQTVRFDMADGLVLDMAESRGVLGSTRHPSGAIYVSLDASEP